MRVVIPLLSLGSYGGVRKILEIANLLAHEHDVHLVYPKSRAKTPFFISPSVSRHPVEAFGLMDAYLKMYSHVVLHRYDLMLANFFPTAYMSFGFRGKVVYFVQDVEDSFYENPVLKMAARLTYAFPVTKVAISPGVAHLTGCDYVIPAGVDKNRFRPLAQPEEAVIGYIPRKWKRKGFHLFLEALRFLRGKLDFSLKLIGGTDIYDQLLSNEGFEFVHVYPRDDSELAFHYSSCYVFVLSSLEEGLGLPVLEALSCGVPVVATRVLGSSVWGDMVELVKAEASSLASGIERVFKEWNSYRRRALRSRDRIPDTHAMYEHFSGVLKDIV